MDKTDDFLVDLFVACLIHRIVAVLLREGMISND